jgi:hypothetical protein
MGRGEGGWMEVESRDENRSIHRYCSATSTLIVAVVDHIRMDQRNSAG